MDQRQTFDNLSQLREILVQLQQQGIYTSLLVDDEGITRMEGLIVVHDNHTDPGVIKMDNGEEVYLKNIIAVNGRFRSDYSEC